MPSRLRELPFHVVYMAHTHTHTHALGYQITCGLHYLIYCTVNSFFCNYCSLSLSLRHTHSFLIFQLCSFIIHVYSDNSCFSFSIFMCRTNNVSLASEISVFFSYFEHQCVVHGAYNYLTVCVFAGLV